MTTLDIPAIRKKLNASQAQFARLFQIQLATLRGWEQGRRKPNGPAKVLLKLINISPAFVLDTLYTYKTVKVIK